VDCNTCSEIGVQILDSVCDGHLDCSDLLASITGNTLDFIFSEDYAVLCNM